MKRLIILSLLITMISGCASLRPHKVDVEQGNILTTTEIQRLQLGMSEAQVKAILGNPILMNIFTPNRLDYVYTSRIGHNEMQEKRIVCIFYRGRLQKIEKYGF